MPRRSSRIATRPTQPHAIEVIDLDSSEDGGDPEVESHAEETPSTSVVAEPQRKLDAPVADAVEETASTSSSGVGEPQRQSAPVLVPPPSPSSSSSSSSSFSSFHPTPHASSSATRLRAVLDDPWAMGDEDLQLAVMGITASSGSGTGHQEEEEQDGGQVIAFSRSTVRSLGRKRLSKIGVRLPKKKRGRKKKSPDVPIIRGAPLPASQSADEEESQEPFTAGSVSVPDTSGAARLLSRLSDGRRSLRDGITLLDEMRAEAQEIFAFDENTDLADDVEVEDEGEAKTLSVQLASGSEETLKFSIFDHQPMERLRRALAARIGVDNVTLSMDGDEVDYDKTAPEQGLEDGDLLDGHICD